MIDDLYGRLRATRAVEYADPQGTRLNVAANFREHGIVCGAGYIYMDTSLFQTSRTSAEGKHQYNGEREKKKGEGLTH